jgi:serine/threonine protein kinase
MSIAEKLSGLALQPLLEGACQALGEGVSGKAAEAVVSFLAGRFRDHSQRLQHALQQANDRAWKAVEIALAGDSWWDRCKGLLGRAEDRAFRSQVQAFLEAAGPQTAPQREEVRRRCLDELRAARKAGHLLEGSLAAEQLAREAGAFAAFSDPVKLLEAQRKALGRIGLELQRHGYSHLADWFAAGKGPALLASAVRYFFRRAVEEDEQLFRGLAFAQLERLQEGQDAAFAGLNQVLSEQGQRLEELLGDVRAAVEATHAAVLDLQNEQQRQGQQGQELYEAVRQLQAKLDLIHREVRPRDSVSIRTEGERRLVRELLQRYRSLPESQRRHRPALLNAVGKLELAAGDFAAAGESFTAVADLVEDTQARAEAHYNAYRAALERHDWDSALAELREAIERDAQRFAPFPLEKYEPQRILGAGGFGVVFLCRHLWVGGPVVVKTLSGEDLGRDCQEVFTEAQVLRQLDHPAIIRLQDCGFVDPDRHDRPFLVMDYFEGTSLEEHVRRHGPLSSGEVLDLALAVAAALQAAHGKGILHRDVKPANLLVRRNGSKQLDVKLIDFGLALQQSALRDTSRTTHHQTLAGRTITGTLDYAAPEQLGKLAGTSVGPAADVYAFGKTCCYALFGTPQPLPKHWRNLPGPLAELLERCLAESPTERPANCDVLCRSLKQLSQSGVVRNVTYREALEVVACPAPPAGQAPLAIPVTSHKPPRPVLERRPVSSSRPRQVTLSPDVRLARRWLFVAAAVAGVFILALTIYALRKPSGGGAAGAKALDELEKRFTTSDVVYLSDLPEIASRPGMWGVQKNGVMGPGGEPIRVYERLSPHGIGLHVPDYPNYCSLTYRLGQRADRFRAIAALNDTVSAPLDKNRGITFEVLGDGKSLWKSDKPLQVRGQLQPIDLDVGRVDVLELRVSIDGAHNGGHAVWFEPRLLKRGAKEDPAPYELMPELEDLVKKSERIYLADLHEFLAVNGPWGVQKNGVLNRDGGKVVVKGKAWLHSISMHPNSGSDGAAACYRLGRLFRTFKATTALNDGGGLGNGERVVIFQVLGDDKVLWQSRRPIFKGGDSEDVTVDVSTVDVLELRTSVNGINLGAHAVWLEPRVLKEGVKDDAGPEPDKDRPDTPKDKEAPKEKAELKKPANEGLFQGTNEVYLSDLVGFAIENGPWGVQTKGLLTQGDGWTTRQDIKVNGKPSPHGISMHAPDHPQYCRVCFHVGKEAHRFKAMVALNDTATRVLSNGVVFQVLGDGRVHWSSERLNQRGKTLDVDVDVSGVDVLELRTSVDGKHIGAHAVWLEPRVQK